ncbi:MAG TPA: hypothetical protein VK518_16635, partial [Puia sp.]|nr:hypothetical protein [Puia sp.]
MRMLVLAFFLLVAGARLSAQQKIAAVINAAAVKKIEKVLSSDDMRGRATFTPDIDRAADYIEAQLKAAGLKTWNGGKSYRQPFVMVRATPVSVTATLDGQDLQSGRVFAVSSSADLSVDENSGYEKATIKAGGNIGIEAMHYIHEKKNYLVLVDTSYTASFPRLGRYGRQQFKSDHHVIFVLTASDPVHYS